MANLFKKFNFLKAKEQSKDGHTMTCEGNREWESLYRDRWSYDKVVRSTHGVNCTGSCSWNIFVKNGIVVWENQNHDYPETDVDMPDVEPRGCPRGATFSWYMYSPLRVKYPYVRGELVSLWREAKKEHANGYDAWQSIVTDPEKTKKYKSARGMGGFVRSNWDEVSEIVAASMLYTAKTYGPDRNFGFSPIPAMSMASYAAGARFMNLMGGACLSFYDWYADLPPASPQVWGDQTDVPESSDWFNSGYIITWGSNVPQTRTPDAHFLTEVRYKGTKVISVSPDYAESTAISDTWLNIKAGSDGALAMAMGHVILREYYWGQPTEYFTAYAKQYTDLPFLVLLDEKDGRYTPGRFLNVKDLGKDDVNGEFKFCLIDEITDDIVVPNGTMGDRHDDKSKWNLKLENRYTGATIDPKLTLLAQDCETLTLTLPYFGAEREETTLERTIPVRRVETAEGPKYVTTVLDLNFANYGVDRGLGDGLPTSYEEDVPYTPKWQEKFTGIDADLVIRTAREFADNALKTKGRSMIIMGAGINHWYHSDIIYRTILNLLVFTGCEGVNGGGWAHYVGQEKLRPVEGWQTIMTAGDWQKPPRLQNSTSFFYFATDQWRSDEIDTTDLVDPLHTPRYKHSGDYNVLAARLGWLPSYPTFTKGGQELVNDALKDGATTNEEINLHVAKQLKEKKVDFAITDPDSPENFPRNLIIWRANLLTSSSKGHEYFLKYLLGTKNGLFEEEVSAVRPEEIKWRDNPPEGKLDLVVTLDFRMAGSALYSDIVLPAATWYEKTDLSSTDMHSFIHPFQAAVNCSWDTRSDWDIFLTLGQAVSKLAKEIDMEQYHDIVAVPLMHDSPGELAQPEGKIRDWSKGECEPIPGKTMPTLAHVKRDYKRIYEKQIGLGPNVKETGVGGHGIAYTVAEEYEELGKRNGLIENKDYISYGMPSLKDGLHVCESILCLSSSSNGKLAKKGWEMMEKNTGLSDLTDLIAGQEQEKMTFNDIVAQPRRVVTTPVFSGSVKDRRYSPFTTSIERLVPFRTITGRQSFYLDHELIQEWGEGMATFKPILDYAPLKQQYPEKEQKEIVLKFLTPHNKWSIHSMYFDSQQMLTLFRGGQTVWINEEDAAEIGVKDNDWLELYNRNGVVTSRAVVTPRIPRGAVYMYHAQDKHINVPGSNLSKTRGGTHNTPTHIHMKPTHMIGGYGQLSYGFNYYGPTGNQRDMSVVVRKMTEVNWLED